MNWIVGTTVVFRVDTTVVLHKRIVKEFYLLTIMRETHDIFNHA